jgi:uncharacterized membrane protein
MVIQKIARNFENILSYEVFIIVGILIVVGALAKLLHFFDFSSDWFWFLAGIGLIVEGAISLAKQRKFDRKYKIVEREAEDK